MQAARAAAKAAEEQRVAAIKAAEAAQQTAKVALATQPDLKPGIWPPVHLDVQAGGLFAEKDAKRVASLGEKYRFLIPDFRIDCQVMMSKAACAASLVFGWMEKERAERI